MRKRLLALCFVLSSPLLAQSQDRWLAVQQTGELRWCADTAGGAPYVFPDEKDPKKIIGFEIDLMEAIGKDLGVQPKLVLGPWEELVPMLRRGDCDTVVNGLEITAEREKVIDFSIPYYYFSEQITARKGDNRFQTLEDLQGHRVGTLAATLAEDILKNDPRITTVPYPTPVECYRDLELGRLDAALLDGPIAAWYAVPNPNLSNSGNPIGESSYGAGFPKDSPILRRKMNEAFKHLIQNGQLEAIYKHWNLWTPAQNKLRTLAEGEAEGRQNQKPWWKFIPLLIQGAGLTVVISCLSMTLAVIFGFVLCYGKLYGGSISHALCNGYIEVIRGTPLLIQLYLLYYGLPNLGIQLNAFVAAVLGMGLNYAAYEAEIYRSGLLSVPKGQSDAARSLGMTRNQSLWYIILPQAVRTILPPSTNDFIALFKDTSLVSIITVAELTKAYSEAATTTYRFLELGLVTAALYFAMSYPLSVWSRSLEKKRHAILH
jgi:polar amino acid transport system substrate-binding protein